MPSQQYEKINSVLNRTVKAATATDNTDSKDRARHESTSSNDSPDHQEPDDSDVSPNASGTTSDSDASSLLFIRNLMAPAKYRRSAKYNSTGSSSKAMNYGSTFTNRQSQPALAGNSAADRPASRLMPLLKRAPNSDRSLAPRARAGIAAPARMRDTERTARRSVTMTSNKKAFFLLLKSFIGSGVLFLPRAFLNGGIMFSSIILSISAMVSLYCMILLVECYQKIPHGYSEIGRRLYGKGMGSIVQLAIVISQTGFACAGTIFVATNIRDLFNAATDCQYRYPLGFWVAAQLAFMIPACLIRHIKGLSSFAMFGDLFVLGGIVYVFVMDVKKISTLGTGFVRNFNPNDYSLFLGTAAYTFEGYAMILPIADSMRRPEKFPRLLTMVMVLCGLIAVTIGAVSYLAYGEDTQAIVILNMPSGTVATLTVQLLYSIAILLTNPLMMYPAIRTIEHWLFPRRSGKHNVGVKMQKNAFRTSFLLVVTAIAVFGLDRLDKLVAIIGGSACVPISFIFPPLFHYKAVARTIRTKIIDLALAGFGMIACVYVTYNAVKRWGIAVPPSDFCDLRP